jgi:hypothetical protein
MNKALVVILSVLALTACGKTIKKYESPVGYDFNAPIKSEMKDALHEISGNVFYPGSAETIYAIQDEDGKLYFWKNGQPQTLQHLTFGDHGDYEDLGLTKTQVVVMRSDGVLFIFPFAEVQAGEIKSVKKWKDLLPEGEYESLYVDANNGKMIILCKNCSVDKHNTSTVSGYELQLNEDGSPVLKGKFNINTAGIRKFKPTWEGPLKPSALTYNSRTNEWFILASVNKLLVVTDQNWNIKQVIALNSTLFPQPEGISFDIDNNLYISNEAGSTPKGTVLKFPYKPSRE